MSNVIGIDEVGWGALAGPVVVCAASVPFGQWDVLKGWGFRDSKKVGNDPKKVSPNPRTRYSANTCDKLVDLLESDAGKGLATWAIGHADAADVDRETPLSAKNRIIRTAFMQLCLANGWDMAHDVEVIMDGQDKVPTLPECVPQEAIPKADDLILPVSVASVIAKSYRDKLMRQLHTRYPAYGFDTNVGYGTEKHFEALIKYGPIPGVHRLCYVKSQVEKYYYRTYTDRDQRRKALPKWVNDLGWAR
jgi:ribonuclease HII